MSDLALQRELVDLLARGRRTEARVVAHIAEVERRNLHLKEGFSSVYKYCQLRLGLSEYESFHRMTAAAIARKYPVVFGLIDQGKIHVSGLCKLRDFLTRANYIELLREACGKTKQQIEELLAARFPTRKGRDSMRRLPRGRGRVRAVAAPPELDPLPSSDPVLVDVPDSVSSLMSSEPGVPTASGGQVDVVDPTTGEVTTVLVPVDEGNEHGTQKRAQLELSVRDASPCSQKPSEAFAQQPRYRVQFDASAAFKAKIDLVKALDSRANPNGDLERLFERAVDLYVEHLQKKRFGETDKPRRSSKASAARTERGRRVSLRSRPSRAQREGAAGNGNSTSSQPTREHLPNETRRAVVAKDGLRCAFVSASGQRCDEQSFLVPPRGAVGTFQRRSPEQPAAVLLGSQSVPSRAGLRRSAHRAPRRRGESRESARSRSAQTLPRPCDCFARNNLRGVSAARRRLAVDVSARSAANRASAAPARAVLAWGQTAFALERIWASTDARHVASRRVLENLGMVCESVRPNDHLGRDGELVDQVVYVLRG